MKIKRIYSELLEEHFSMDRQMLFLAGPRQVGKTTISEAAAELTDEWFYFNWDIQEHRAIIIQGPQTVGNQIFIERAREMAPIVVFDEIHKYSRWKTFLKGFFDLYKGKVHIIVTGSAKLDVYQSGGDSLMGRYFPYRVHPLSIAECIRTTISDREIRPPAPIEASDFEVLWKYGGYPEPFLKRNDLFYTKWKLTRFKQFFEEDIRDLTQIHELAQLELLSDLLKHQAGQLLNYHNLANKVNVSVNTIRRWISVFERLYYCFLIRPWTKNVTRSLLKEPKLFLWDWSDIDETGARAENFVGSHLLKAVHFWMDRGFGKYKLYFVRDKEKREVDFLVTKNQKPWFLVEVKHSANMGISKHLYRFQEQVQAPHAFQVIVDSEFVDVDCFSYNDPVIVPAKTFLSQLV